MKILISILLLASSFIACKKDSKDDKMSLFILLFALNQSSGQCKSGLCFTFASATSTSLRSPDSKVFTPPTGDGTADGFNDVLLTPKVMGLSICDIMGYKSEANGGPAAGSETALNGTALLNFGGNDCEKFMIVAIKEGQLPNLNYNSSEVGKTYNRIGIVLKSVNVYFSETDIPDPNRRYWSAEYSNPLQSGIYSGSFPLRGFVFNTVPTDKCSDASVNDGAFVDPLPNSSFGKDCTLGIIPIKTNGGELGTGMPGTPKYPLQHTVQNLTQGDSLSLKYKQPSDMARFNTNQAYVVTLPVSSESVGSNGALIVNLYRDNMLFFDSNDVDKKYDPVNSSNDRPNSSNGTTNLSTPADKNIIFNAPTFELKK